MNTRTGALRLAIFFALLRPAFAPPPAQACSNPTCSSPPCAASDQGDVGCTTVSGTETYNHELTQKGGTIASNAHIYGAFEAGFSSQQDSIIEGWGCTNAALVYDTEGGLDLDIAERKVAHACGITLPRISGNNYIGIVGPCGGHTADYHFHVRLSCLFAATGGHSTKVGVAASRNVYGKWEDKANNLLPLLDACSAHFGPTPDSSGASVYHHHVQDKAPFVVGCHGPTAGGGLVSVSACRALYPKCSNAAVNVATAAGTVSYVRYCPCFDANGLNSGSITELPALSTSNISVDAGATTSGVGTTGGTTTGSLVSAAQGTASEGSAKFLLSGAALAMIMMLDRVVI